MKLYQKTTLIILITLSILSTLLYYILANSVSKNFNEVETQYTQEAFLRVKDGLKNLEEQLLQKQSDWTAWDDTYQFITDNNKAYQESNLEFSSLSTLQIDFAFFTNDKNRIIAERYLDYTSESLGPMPALFKSLVENNSDWLSHEGTQSKKSGFIVLEEKIFLVASQPILQSSKEGPIRGALVWGYELRLEKLQKLSNSLHQNFKLILVDDFNLSMTSNEIVITRSSNNFIHAAQYLTDFYNKPRFLLKVELERKIYQQSLNALSSLKYALLICSVTFALLFYLLLNIFILKRLRRVRKELYKIANQPDSNLEITFQGKDEIGGLTRHINKMMEAKINSQKQISSLKEELYQSQKLESLGKLAGGVAHDFNNLLGGILGYTSLLQEEYKDNSKTSKRLAMIRKSAERGAELTKKLLGFARKGNYEKKVLQLNKIAEEVYGLVHPTLEKNIILKMNLSQDLKSIEGDESQMVQVIMNLVVNAKDALSQGGEIEISTKNITWNQEIATLFPKLKEGDYVQLIVKDNGQGIPKDILQKIFEPFFSTKGVGKGTGLGLSMVLGIMESHEGAIRVDSEEGQSSIFTLMFPAKNVLSPVNITQQQEKQKIHFENIKEILQKKQVLIVDDEESMRELNKDILSKFGCLLLEATNGAEATQKFKQNPETQLVLLDILMPIKDGLTAFKEIFQLQPKAKVIFCSAYAEDEKVLAIRKNHKVGFVRKPFSEEDLLKEINTLLFE